MLSFFIFLSKKYHKQIILIVSCAILFLACKKKPYQLNSTVFVFEEKGNFTPFEQEKAQTPPSGMCYVPSAWVHIGSDENEQENPRLWLWIKPFFMDISPVTVGEFRTFVRATHYVTEAEKFGNAGFIDATSSFKWTLKKGANWEFPQGRDFAQATDNEPVTQVSWNDAQAYAKWIGKRLPHEWEWEHAARNARNDQTRYAFGDSLQSANGKWRTNIWQGVFPFDNRLEDAYRFASPVGVFGKTPLGLTDMTGNVWQWCDNDRFEYAALLRALKNGQQLVTNPSEKVQRGGSYLCEEHWCHGYRVSGRSFCSPETALMHVGFRCVKDIYQGK